MLPTPRLFSKLASKRSAWSGLILSAAVLAAGPWSESVFAQETAPAVIPVDKKLASLADDFLHYVLVNNAELAKANADALVASTQPPEEVLKAFEDAAHDRNYREVLAQAQRRKDLQESATKLIEKIEQGARNVARDPKRIRDELEQLGLGRGTRAYENAKKRLAAAGQFAVPIYLEYLQNAAKNDLHPFIVQLMGEIGRPLLNPLIEELRVSDPTLRVELINVIGHIGYPQALPELRAIQVDEKTPAEVKAAVDNAIAMIDRTGQAAKLAPGDLYLAGAKYYYDKQPSYQPLLQDEKTNPVWIFDKGLNNVVPMNVPTPIWNSVMALRMAEAALKIDPDNGEAISLWLAADARREIQLPAGATDPTKTAGVSEAAFFLRATGPIYVNPVLARALDARDAPLALRAIDALEATGGVNGLVSTPNSPLIRALSNSDRAVRFRAAFALARANPPTQFNSFFRVVPILSEAISATGAPTAIVIARDDDQRNALTDALRVSDAHFNVYAGSTLSSGLEQARRAAAVDLIILPDSDKDSLNDLARTDYRIASAPVLVTAPAGDLANVRGQIASRKGFAAIDEKADVAAITAGLQAARADVGTVAISAEASSQYAATALDLLGRLAADHRTIYAVNEAVPTLVSTLKDKRPEIVAAAAHVLGAMNSEDGQRGLAAAALAPDADAALRIIFFQQLAESAKHTGNVLDASAVNGIIKIVTSDSDPKTRLAAATALGALNVPSNQASTLILQQAK